MFRKTMLKYLGFRTRFRLLSEKKILYMANTDKKTIECLQLKKFNSMWGLASNKIKFYMFWKNKYNLPSELQSIHDLTKFPELTKEIVNNYRELIFNINGRYKIISTGGSTGVPTKFPVRSSELNEIYANTYTGRSWWNIDPFDRVILLWGHSHLFGSGVVGTFNEYKRKVKDSLINTTRLNAYDMRMDTIKYYYEEILRVKPNVIIGYSSCLYKISRYIIDNEMTQVSLLKLKAVIATAETLSEYEIKTIQKAFCAPVVIEYGSAEMGALSYSNPKSKRMNVFWDAFYCHADADDMLFATSLNSRAFPLINYNTNDTIKTGQDCNHGILSFLHITGRAKQELQLRTISGELLICSGILIIHIMKNFPRIYSVQCKQTSDIFVEILLVSDINLDLTVVKQYFFLEISKTHPQIDWSVVNFVQVDDVTRTIAGKEKILH